MIPPASQTHVSNEASIAIFSVLGRIAATLHLPVHRVKIGGCVVSAFSGELQA
jgi:hypothetical protein